MSAIDADIERLTEPLRNTSRKFYVALVVSAIVSLGVGVAYLSQLRFGMAITGLDGWGTQGGVPWGLYIGTFVWWIGIAHGGVAISAAVRLFDFKEYLPIARIAEILTLIALPMAATNILFDIGRPDQLWVMITNWPTTVQTSPLTWDMTATFLYFIMAGTYLVITLRNDLYDCMQRGTLPSALSPLYKLLLLGYRPSEREKTHQMAWWMAVGILLLVPLMSGGVVPWLFATMGMHPGWFGASHGPAMFAESMTSAIAAVVITAAAFRWAYGWDDVISDEIFRGLNKALIALVLVTLWFLAQDLVTGSYPAAPTDVGELTASLVTGSMATPFWLAVGGLVVALAYLVAQALRPSLFSIGASVIAAVLVTGSILLKKVVFVVEGLLYPTRDPLASMFPANSYWPTIPEFVMALGTIGVAVLIFLVATKIIPIVELEHARQTDEEEADSEVIEA
ncbi:NrfD/PsrC family molybdoenzyme membrane anchor subunit [Natrialbaceae archaeon AArc-T1-2]|uniref:NrfD/PsrC family molybdoenzyme membrane anchor subunit n=1 Tax=Natrialbaceae archaeon AArc-T1-2 TaxID=3053904 RepID=UPI00255A718E|nr:NrfD/PsrC family molybdoenzyme membrane anchor subunit [Natrialbaceae archaeon AArc-T1-2]WIV66483.1 polysulfide reductase NrfD [Natrialbaceae archaeon AArc-T1-2]